MDRFIQKISRVLSGRFFAVGFCMASFVLLTLFEVRVQSPQDPLRETVEYRYDIQQLQQQAQALGVQAASPTNELHYVKLTDGDNTLYCYTAAQTVEELLQHEGIRLGEEDYTLPSADTELRDLMEITVCRVTYGTMTVVDIIPYQTHVTKVKTIPAGKTVVQVKGQRGAEETVTRIRYVNGQVESTEELETVVVTKPVTQEEQTGVGGSFVGADGKTYHYSYYIDMKATAYTYGENGKWGDITATGKPVQEGYVAVDRKVIPLGTDLYVDCPGSWEDYGACNAQDVGGAIKGNRIDLFYADEDTMWAFGVRKVRVYILED
ncbi:MAG: G5 domain-containing protein [Clostridia bacterium]|nr:G5 domain-containing protein [Clostridia bacterium]